MQSQAVKHVSNTGYDGRRLSAKIQWAKSSFASKFDFNFVFCSFVQYLSFPISPFRSLQFLRSRQHILGPSHKSPAEYDPERYTCPRICPSMAFGAAMATAQQVFAATSSCDSHNNGSQMWGRGLKSGINVAFPAKPSKGVVRMGLKEDGPSVAVVGATGAVGLEFLSVLSDRDFPYRSLKLLASKRSAGKHLPFEGRDYVVEELTEDSFGGIDIALFSAGGSISKKFGPVAAAQGTIVVDNSSAFRMDDGIPLVIPEVNPEAMTHIKLSSKKGALIANPNCSTIICLMAVTPLHRFAKVKRMVVSTYQAASGAGAAAMAELEQQTREVLEGKRPTCNIFSQQYAFNLFSHNSSVLPNGYNEEEMKLVKETRKIWGDQDVRVTATCVRVPVMRAHAESVNLQFEKPLDEDTARDILKKADGIIVIDDRAANYFPTPLEVSNKDDVAVGRIRHDVSQNGNYGLDLFVCGDQIRKGAALNAVQIAERLL